MCDGIGIFSLLILILCNLQYLTMKSLTKCKERLKPELFQGTFWGDQNIHDRWLQIRKSCTHLSMYLLPAMSKHASVATHIAFV